MTRGRYAPFFWGGIALSVIGASMVLSGSGLDPVSATGLLAGLAGLLLYEHAYVQAGQSVPLA